MFHEVFDNRWTLRNALNGVNTIMSLSGMLIAVFALIVSSHRQREDKAVEMTSYFQKRYADVTAEREALSVDTRDTIACKRAAIHYWNLQLEQYQFWKRGLIPKEFFVYWMNLRHREAKAHERFGSMNYLRSWFYAKDVLAHEKFTRFMNKILLGNMNELDEEPHAAPDNFLWRLVLMVSLGVVFLLSIIAGLLLKWKIYYDQTKKEELAQAQALAVVPVAQTEPAPTANGNGQGNATHQSTV